MGKTKSLRDQEGGLEKRGEDTTMTTEGSQSAITQEQELPASLQTHLNKVLAAINASRESLEHKIETVIIDVNLLRADQQKIADRVKSTETQILDIQPTVESNTTQLQEIRDKIKQMEKRVEELEGRDRRSNIRVIGMTEGMEGTNMIRYLDDWIRREVAGEELSPFFAFERAHRVPGRRPQPGLPARAIVAKLLHYQDRDTILQKARTNGPYAVGNVKVSIFPDYTFNVQKQRASFLAVKKELRNEGIQYALMFPAKLKIMVDGKANFFVEPREVRDWLELYRKGRDAPPAPAQDKSEWTAPKPKRKKQVWTSRKPTRTQSEREKRAALRAAGSLTKGKSHGDGDEDPPEQMTSGTESDPMEVLGETLPGMTPRSADDL